MKPGRELDVLVAKKVMGFEVISHTALNEKGMEYEEYYRASNGKINPGLKVPHYSTEVESAYDTFDRINANPERFLSGTHGVTVTIKLSDGVIFEAIGDDIPHAICLAALKAKGVAV